MNNMERPPTRPAPYVDKKR